tara:strand:+ start:217 stop:330 length:114 start_codon:yes stop_codon:yes gene_type:complete
MGRIVERLRKEADAEDVEAEQNPLPKLGIAFQIITEI